MELVVVALALSSMKPIVSPRSWLFSILFFAVELNVAFRVRSGGKPALLMILPPIFVLWANLHIQFSYGLAVLGLFAVESWVAAMRRSEARGEKAKAIPLGPMLATVIGCALATLVNPYHYRLILVIFELAAQTEAFKTFRSSNRYFSASPADWFILALALTTAFRLVGKEPPPAAPRSTLHGCVAFVSSAADSWVVVYGCRLIGDHGTWSAFGESFGIPKQESSSSLPLSL
jgi:hypothetical protein